MPAPTALALDALMHELRKCAAWEDLSGATAAARQLAALPGDEVPARMVRELARLDDIDLTDDAGDVGDEVYRARSALETGLVLCGARATAWLRPLLNDRACLDRPTRPATRAALRVLAELGDPAALPVARQLLADDDPESRDGRLAAIQALGRLRPPDARALLRGLLDRVGDSTDGNTGWTKRLTAHALGEIGDVDALGRLLQDRDWFARLGAAEALAKLPAGQGEAERARACRDPDPRVAKAARRS